MRTATTLLTCALLGVLITACSSDPDEGPEVVVRAVVDARTAGDCEGFEDHFVDGDPDVRCGDPQPVVGAGPQVGDATIDNDEATVEVVDYYDCSAWDVEPQEYVDRYHVAVHSGEWKVDDVELGEPTSDDCFS